MSKAKAAPDSAAPTDSNQPDHSTFVHHDAPAVQQAYAAAYAIFRNAAARGEAGGTAAPTGAEVLR
jgi:hypothetical protein